MSRAKGDSIKLVGEKIVKFLFLGESTIVEKGVRAIITRTPSTLLSQVAV
jgi:hypothetical protein